MFLSVCALYEADRMTTFCIFAALSFTIFLDVATLVYLETQDDGPNEPKYEAVVAVDNVMGPHVL